MKHSDITFDSGRRMMIFGVDGVLTHRTIHPTKSKPGLWYKQVWESEQRRTNVFGRNELLTVQITFDDECGNGHNTFSITGHTNKGSGGCIHDEIAQAFPELAPLIQWHLCSTDGPMHYLSNTIYHLSDKDHHGKRKGEPTAFQHGIRFTDFPITTRISSQFARFLRDIKTPHTFEVVEVPHKTQPHLFNPHYSVKGFCDSDWAGCPFSDKASADEVVLALNSYDWDFVKIPVKFSEGKTPDIDEARRTANWPDMPADIVNWSEEQIKQVLTDRLENLINQFKIDMVNCGFYLSPEHYKEHNG